MITALILISYIIIGIALIRGTLYLSHYSIEEDGLDKWRFIWTMILLWPLFLALMIGYWLWVNWYNIKYWMKI